METIKFILDHLDWLGYGILMVGFMKAGSLKKEGWVMNICGSIILLTWGLHIKHYGVVFWNIIYAIIYVGCYMNFAKNSNLTKGNEN